ncbi:MAG TPA: MerR family transcriptional regulator [Vicinamibacterales bacterium]
MRKRIGAVHQQVYRVQAFADLAGVTVRALHHYDRLALLRPKRTRAGYRVYGVSELLRLEQIVALKFLGFPLKQIKALLDRDGRPLPEVLRAQRRALEEKRRRLDQAIAAITDAESSFAPGEAVDPAVIRRIIQTIDMQGSRDAMRKYYSEDAQAELERRQREMTPAERAAAQDGTRRWRALFAEIEAALGEDPSSAKAQAFVDRWDALIHEFTRGHAGITEGLARAWTDRANWPEPMKELSEPFADRRIFEFIRRARGRGRQSAFNARAGSTSAARRAGK